MLGKKGWSKGGQSCKNMGTATGNWWISQKNFLWPFTAFHVANISQVAFFCSNIYLPWDGGGRPRAVYVGGIFGLGI